METLQLIFSTVGVVVSGASMIVAGLDVVAKITPSDKDDKALDAAKRGLGFVSAVLDKVSIWNWQKKEESKSPRHWGLVLAMTRAIT